MEAFFPPWFGVCAATIPSQMRLYLPNIYKLSAETFLLAGTLHEGAEKKIKNKNHADVVKMSEVHINMFDDYLK